MLSAVSIPGIFVTGTDTGVGKTIVAGGIADWFRRQAKTPGVCKIAATGCVHRREGLVSEDAEFLAMCADSRFPLDVIAPVRYAEPLAPAIAAERAREPMDWESIDRSIQAISRESDVMVIEGVGGLMVPMDAKITVLDVVKWLKIPVVIVARPGLGTINHTLLTIESLRAAKATIAGVVINRYPAEMPGTAEETNPRAIEKWGKVNVLTLVPDETLVGARLPGGIRAAMDRVDWERFAQQ